jgi:competence protein ComEC
LLLFLKTGLVCAIGRSWIHAQPRSAGVAVAITVGDSMYLDRDVQKTLRAANLSHLLAISGLHMGLLTSLVFFFTRALMSCLPI